MPSEDSKTYRLSQAARKLNISIQTAVDRLKTSGYTVPSNPNTKIGKKEYRVLEDAFALSAIDKEEASALHIGDTSSEDMVISAQEHARKGKKSEEKIFIKNLSNQEIAGNLVEEKTPSAPPSKLPGITVVGKVDLKKKAEETEPAAEKEPPKEGEDVIRASAGKLRKLVVVDKIELAEEKPKTKDASKPATEKSEEKKKRSRRRISAKGYEKDAKGEGVVEKKEAGDRLKKKTKKEEISRKDIQDNIKSTLKRLSQSKGGTSRGKHKKDKQVAAAEVTPEGPQETKQLRVTEFVSVHDLASLLSVSVQELITSCMNLGMFVSINQRLDAEAITLLVDEYGYEAIFTSAGKEEEALTKDHGAGHAHRAPVVTIMGHVDHGKTSLLDFIRQANVTGGEVGGITQHIGAYEVQTSVGKKVAFLDTPGHAAFTAMRARGAKLTDVAIIVIAGDDSIRPQTEEAITHVKVAGVPFVVALNKMDKEDAKPDLIREQLSKMNILVEEWGGKYQCQEISAKTGKGVEALLEKVLLEAEILDLKASPEKPAVGVVIEASLDKGRGYVSTVLVQDGTLRKGDITLAGSYYGKVKAMFDHVGQSAKEAGPSTPVQILGLDGPPQAGDRFVLCKTERQAREVANERKQILREQSIRTQKHITLDEIGRRMALGSFKELNLIVKGDVDGSLEALGDSLLKLSTEEVQVNIIHKAVGAVSESDVLLAAASHAIIIGFQVRALEGAKKIAERDHVEIRTYSVIFDAIQEIKSAIEGMLMPKVEEVVIGTGAVKQVFKVTKVGTVAGCKVEKGKLQRQHMLRLIRDGIVIHEGKIEHLKRFKENVQEVKEGYECGLSLAGYSDIQEGDTIEGFERREMKPKATSTAAAPSS